MLSELHVIGLAAPEFNPEQEGILCRCHLLVGPERLRPLLAGVATAPIISITPLTTAIKAIATALHSGPVAVLASGDPLFYGIGRRLLAEFPPAIITIHPALSALQRACARFKLPWDDAAVVSLHGRPPQHLPGLLLAAEKTLVFTDQHHRPEIIARNLLDYLTSVGGEDLLAGCRLSVAEELGLAGEQISHGSLAEIAGRRFADLNILAIQRPPLPTLPPFAFGLVEGELHHSRGLITKNAVRAASLHQLRLPREGVFWDIGAGSGSLSVEAARIAPRLLVYAIEQSPEEIDNIKKNIVKFATFNIVALPGRAPECLAGLPAPDRVFVGGSGGSLAEIISAAAGRLAPTGRLVVNAVLAATATAAPELMRREGLTVTHSTIRVNHTDEGGSSRDLNPITITCGRR